MAITRDSRHKRRATGGRRKVHKKKRQFETGRPAAMTKLGEKRVRPLRVRGGNYKFRALRLDHGNFSWGSEAITRKTKVFDVVYNASNNELVRTKTLVKGCIVQIDVTPFRQWFENHYKTKIGVKKGQDATFELPEKMSGHVTKTMEARHASLKAKPVDANLEAQFAQNRVYARVSSRPGQSGRVDGYILEGKELEFYSKQLQKKKSGKKN